MENRVERHDTYINNSLLENKRQIQKENNDTKDQISRLENRVEQYEIMRQLQTVNIGAKVQVLRLENRVER